MAANFYYGLIVLLICIETFHCIVDKDGIKRECGKTKGCLFKPDSCMPFDNCAYFMSYSTGSTKSDTVTLELMTKLKGPENQYVAVGFSGDTKMGDDSVTYCIYDAVNSTHVAGLAYNPPGDKTNLILPDATAMGLVTLVDSAVVDGTFFCKVIQKIRPNLSNKEVRNLDNGHYLLLASGPATPRPSSLKMHVLDAGNAKFPFVSASPINVAQFDSSSSAAKSTEVKDCIDPATKFNLVKAHGILMLFGWWLCVAMAELIARYFRTALAERQLFGSAVWFNFHRGFNLLGVLLIASAFICIFIKTCGTWSGGANTYNHAVLGMTASICAFVQPIIAMFRCHPGEAGRWIFNWIHRIIGVGALGCACAAIWFASDFLGLGLNPADTDGNGSAGKGMIIFYYVSIIFVIICLESLITISERLTSNRVSQGIDSNQFRMEPLKNLSQGLLNYKTWNLLRISLLALFLIIAIAVCITLACFIGLS